MTVKTLIILLGSARGGEETWNSMYKYLMKPLSADLALLFGKTDNKKSSLYQKAKFVWEIDEFTDWWDYFEKFFSHRLYEIYKKNEIEGLGGGIKDFRGSGAIIFAFRHFLKSNYKKQLLNYDRIILTRSDLYYIDFHPDLKNNYFYIVEGERYGGLSDRHHIFPSSIIDDVLSINEYLDDQNNYNYLIKKKLNPERALYEYYKDNGLIKNIRFCKRVQFIVAKENESKRWSYTKGYMFNSRLLLIKYQKEYYRALRNKYGLLIGTMLRLIFHFFKKKNKKPIGHKTPNISN
tara:strand:+ start:436 stop:1311 length:876 start_codon:yes stop_codon:yes gene_type:complete